MNNTNLALFEFDGKQVRFIGGKPVANDVAEALGYADPAKTISTKIDSDFKSVTKTVTVDGKEREVVVLDEAGIYQLIFSSKLETAKRFQHWVFVEVLPSLRTTGTYTIPSTTAPVGVTTPTLNERIRAAHMAIDSIFAGIAIVPELVAGIRLNVTQTMMPEIAGILEQSRQLLINSTARDEQLMTPTQLGEQLGMSAIKVNLKLEEIGLQVKNINKVSRKDASWLPTPAGKPHCTFTLATKVGSTDTFQQLRWFSDVIEKLQS